MPWKVIGQQVLITLVSAVVLAILAYVWNWTTSGGLVRAIGGVTDSPGIATIPKGAVVAFDLNSGCPHGWVPYRKSAGRFIVGVGQHSTRDKAGKEIEKLRIGEIGGHRTHTLMDDEMPLHKHDMVWGQRHDLAHEKNIKAEGNSFYTKGMLYGYIMEQDTGSAGKSKSHNNMPPYIALLYCTSAD